MTNNNPAAKRIDTARAWRSFKGHSEAVFRFLRAAFIFLLTRSLFPAIVAIVGAVAGLAASVYSAELKAAIPLFQKGAPWSDYSSDAIAAAGLFVTFFVLYALQQMAKNMQEADARVALFAETDKLKQLVGRLETLPPDGFLQQFQSLYRDVAALSLLAYRTETTLQDAATAVRSVLKSIAALAHKFDNAPDGSYTANLMICHTAAQIRSLKKEQQDDLEERLIFCPEVPKPKLMGLRAVLNMVSQLTSDYDDTAKSSRVPSIVLPIPVSTDVDLGPEQGIRSKLIPGAPFAAVTHRYVAFDSIRALLDWCRNRSDTTKETLSEVTAFFHNGRGSTVKSFISIPICIVLPAENAPGDMLDGLAMYTENNQSVEVCLAVLNIHSPNEGILGGSGYAMFVPIIEPFVRVLALLAARFGESLSTSLATGATLSSESEGKNAN